MISKAGFIIMYPIIRNRAINSMTFPITAMPDQSPLHAADIDPNINNNINASKCILYPSFCL